MTLSDLIDMGEDILIGKKGRLLRLKKQNLKLEQAIQQEEDFQAEQARRKSLLARQEKLKRGT